MNLHYAVELELFLLVFRLISLRFGGFPGDEAREKRHTESADCNNDFGIVGGLTYQSPL